MREILGAFLWRFTALGNINQEIIECNMKLEQTKEMLMFDKWEVHSAWYAKIKNSAVDVKNEVMEMLAKVMERKGRFDLLSVESIDLEYPTLTANPMRRSSSE